MAQPAPDMASCPLKIVPCQSKSNHPPNDVVVCPRHGGILWWLGRGAGWSCCKPEKEWLWCRVAKANPATHASLKGKVMEPSVRRHPERRPFSVGRSLANDCQGRLGNELLVQNTLFQIMLGVKQKC